MKWQWKLGTFAGIDVFVHATFLLIVGWYGWTYWLETRTLTIAGKQSKWQLVGIVQEILAPPFAYVTKEALNRNPGLDGIASALVIVGNDRSVEHVTEMTRGLESQFASAGLDVASTMRLADARKMIEDHLLLLASFLMIMSIRVLLVGGFGLASTMSINVMERTREIGVLRAIGASAGSILNIIVSEGATIGALAWILALIISLPISRFVSTTFGMTFFEAPLQFADFNPPKNPLLNHLTSALVGPEMMQTSVWHLSPILSNLGSINVSSGPTGSAFLAFVRGDKPA